MAKQRLEYNPVSGKSCRLIVVEILVGDDDNMESVNQCIADIDSYAAAAIVEDKRIAGSVADNLPIIHSRTV